MSIKIRGLSFCLFVLFTLAFILPSLAGAAVPVAQVSFLKGDVVILSGTEIIPVTRVGYSINEGDRVQTKDGELELEFKDGAIMKVRPFTNTMIQEREEKSGFFIFKTKKAVRRITCFVGKLRFSSGKDSKKKNFLQTPTAVCGLRGTEGDLGFSAAGSFLTRISGDFDTEGSWTEGFFDDPTIDDAQKNEVYQAISAAYEADQAAKASDNAVDSAQATVQAVQAIKLAAVALQANPSAKVATEAQVVSTTMDAAIAAAEAKVKVEEVKETQAEAEEALSQAQTQGDTKAIELAQAKAQEAASTSVAIEAAAAEAQAAADQAQAAAVVVQEAIANEGTVDMTDVNAAVQRAEETAEIVTTTVETSEKVVEAIEAAETLYTEAAEAADPDAAAAAQAQAQAVEAAAAQAQVQAEEVRAAADALDLAAVQAEAQDIDNELEEVQDVIVASSGTPATPEGYSEETPEEPEAFEPAGEDPPDAAPLVVEEPPIQDTEAASPV